jgi:hypothetical protein
MVVFLGDVGAIDASLHQLLDLAQENDHDELKQIIACSQLNDLPAEVGQIVSIGEHVEDILQADLGLDNDA